MPESDAHPMIEVEAHLVALQQGSFAGFNQLMTPGH